MTTKIDKIARHLNDNFRYVLLEKFKEKFGLEITTTFDIFSMNLISLRADGKDFTKEQAAYIEAFETGYLAAMNQVRE